MQQKDQVDLNTHKSLLSAHKHQQFYDSVNAVSLGLARRMNREIHWTTEEVETDSDVAIVCS